MHRSDTLGSFELYWCDRSVCLVRADGVWAVKAPGGGFDADSGLRRLE